jgi:hypothetical protein
LLPEDTDFDIKSEFSISYHYFGDTKEYIINFPSGTILRFDHKTNKTYLQIPLGSTLVEKDGNFSLTIPEGFEIIKIEDDFYLATKEPTKSSRKRKALLTSERVSKPKRRKPSDHPFRPEHIRWPVESNETLIQIVGEISADSWEGVAERIEMLALTSAPMEQYLKRPCTTSLAERCKAQSEFLGPYYPEQTYLNITAAASIIPTNPKP